MQKGLFALAAVSETNDFVQAEIGVAAFFHAFDIAGADAVIFESNELFDAGVVVSEFLELPDKAGTDAVIFHTECDPIVECRAVVAGGDEFTDVLWVDPMIFRA